MARMTRSTTLNSLIALAVGRHNLALTQSKKYQFPFEKSGFRQFGKWTSGKTNVIQTGTLLSQISLTPSPRSVWWSSPSLSTVPNYRIGHREQEYCQSTTILGLKKRETKCAQGVRTLSNAFEECVLGEGKSVDQSSSDLAVNVDHEMKGDGEHVLKIKGFTPSSTEGANVERAKQMAQKAALLLLYGEMLQNMGKKLHDQSRTSVSIVERTASPNSDSNE